MRKSSFYPKLALNNLWRNRSTYVPFLLASMTAILTFYTLMAISTHSVSELRGQDAVQAYTTIGTVILAIFSVIILLWTNGFLIKRRKKEIALYSILGMEGRNIAIVLFFETLFIAIIALILGLLGGVLVSKLLYAILQHLVHFDVILSLPVSITAMLSTSLFFGAVFFVTLLVNLRQVYKARPTELLSGAKQGEKEPKAKPFITILGILCIAGGYGMALYFNSPVEALLLFLVAAILVIIGTYCLFTAGSVAWLKALRRNKSYYYQPKHFISVSGMLYRMKQNAAGLASICVLSCMVLVTVSATVALYSGSDASLRYDYPYDYRITSYYNEATEEISAAMPGIIESTGLEVDQYYDYNIWPMTAERDNDGNFTLAANNWERTQYDFALMTIDDYNALSGENVTLGENEAVLFSTFAVYGEETLTLDGTTYRVQQAPSLHGLKNGIAAVSPSYTFIVRDKATAQDIVMKWLEREEYYDEGIVYRNVSGNHIFAIDFLGTQAEKATFNTAFWNNFANTSTLDNVAVLERGIQAPYWYAQNGGFVFLGIYFGLLFLLATTMIIYYKQLSEGYDDRERFEIMQKVGMSEQEVRRTIRSQIRSVFFLPLGVALIHVAVAFNPLRHGLVVFSIINGWHLLLALLCTAAGYALLYWLIYRRTARTYYRIVRREA